MNKKILLVLMLGMFFISFASAYLGTYKQGEVILVRGDLNATSVNVSIYFPNSSIAVDNKEMTNLRGDIWNYSFSSTDTLGEYIYDYCDQNGDNCRENVFEVTPSGSDAPTSGESMTFLGSLIAMLLVGGVFLFLSISLKEHDGARFAFTSLTVITAIIIVLYSAVALSETFFGFDRIVSSYSIFLWVFLFVVFILFIFVLVMVIVKTMDSIRIKRGLQEEHGKHK